jgi:hypothetical protein
VAFRALDAHEGSLSISINFSTPGSTSWWRIPTGWARRPSALGIHAALEICHAPLRKLDLGARHGASVLLDRVKQHHKVLGLLVQDPKAGVCEAHTQLTQLPLNLGG